MDTTTKEQLQKKLEAEEKRLVTELGNILGNRDDGSANTARPSFPQFGAKDDENAAEVATFSDALSLQRNIEDALKDVRRALDRMRMGEYGHCRYCGQAIDERRLLARPESGSCVTCKEELKSQP